MHIYKRIICIIVTLCILVINNNYCKAQFTIKGIVLFDTMGNPSISNASIQCKEVNTNTVIGFTRTKSNGDFSINIPSTYHAVIIECRAIGYSVFKKRITDTVFNNPIRIVLKKEKLEEVIIISSGVNLNEQDTTKFNAAQYKTGTEFNIQELIEKLPGVQVLDNGKITFNNKPVSNVLIEGDDLLGSGYTKYTKNFGNTGIESFEFIENYIDSLDRIMGIIGKKTVLNIVYNKVKRFFGTANAALDVQLSNAIINADFLRLGKTKKNLGYINANNIGATGSISNNTFEFFDDADISQNIKPQFDQQTYFPIPLISKFGIKQERLNQNNSIHGNISAHKKTKRQATLRTNLTFFADDNKQRYDNILRFTEPQPFTYNQTHINNIKERFLGFEALYITPKNSKWVTVIKPRINFLYKKDNAAGFFQAQSNAQQFKATRFKVENLITFSKKINLVRRSIYNVFASYENTPDEYIINNLTDINNFLGLPLKDVLQQKHIERLGIVANKTMQGKLKSWRLKHGFTVKTQVENWNRKLGIINNGEAEINTSNNNDSKLYIGLAEMEQTLQRTIRYTNDIVISNKTLYANVATGSATKNVFALFPNISFKKAFNSRTTLDINSGRYYTLPTLTNTLSNYWINGVNSLRKGSNALNLNTSVATLLVFSKAYSNKVSTSYSLSHRNARNAYLPNYNNYSNFQYLNDTLNRFNNNYTHVNIYVRLTTSYKKEHISYLTISVDNNVNNSNYYVSNTINRARSFINSYRLEFNINAAKRYFGKLDVKFAQYYNAFNVFQSQKLKYNQSNLSSTQYLSSFIKKRYAFEIRNELLSIMIKNQPVQFISLFDLSFKIPIGKNETVLGIEGKNIFNATRFTAFTVYNNVSNTQNFNLFPRLLMLSFRKTF